MREILRIIKNTGGAQFQWNSSVGIFSNLELVLNSQSHNRLSATQTWNDFARIWTAGSRWKRNCRGPSSPHDLICYRPTCCFRNLASFHTNPKLQNQTWHSLRKTNWGEAAMFRCRHSSHIMCYGESVTTWMFGKTSEILRYGHLCSTKNWTAS